MHGRGKPTAKSGSHQSSLVAQVSWARSEPTPVGKGWGCSAVYKGEKAGFEEVAGTLGIGEGQS